MILNIELTYNPFVNLQTDKYSNFTFVIYVGAD
jgi:hypothetical protein